MFWGHVCNSVCWCRFRVFPFRSQNSMWFDFMLFYPLTSLITGTEKKLWYVCLRVCNSSPSSPSRGSISLGPPPRLPSDKVNKVCLANPARKYLFWKLPHPPGDAHVRSRVLRYIYGDNPDAAGLRTHTHTDPSVTQDRPLLGPQLRFSWTWWLISLHLVIKTFSSYSKSCQQFAFLFHSDFLTLSL